jgi:type IX secretion system PorP/SprF family membrane protein
VSAGIVGFSENFYFGVAGKHLNRPAESLINSADDSRLPMRFTAHAGADIKIGGNSSKFGSAMSLSPNIIFTRQAEFYQLNIGVYAKYGSFTAGTWLRPGDAFIMSIGVDTGGFRFGYSYDITTSTLSNASGGSHELSLGMNFNCKKPIQKFRTISCPSF